jgi:hypothetical protein
MEKLKLPSLEPIAPNRDLDPPAASLFVRGVLYAWRKSFGIRFDPRLRSKVLDLFSQVKPMRAIGVPKARIGTSRDGGYVMLDDFGSVAGAYSIGIGRDVSWDLDIAGRGLPIFQFDHTIARPPVSHPLFRFEQLGLGVRTEPNARLETLENMLRHQPDEAGQLILKMDVEGAEWKILDQLSEGVLPRFWQIVCEFHNFHEIGREAWYDRAHHVFSLLNKTHQAVHMHRNNWGPRIWIGDIEIPFFAEITFASREVYAFEATDEEFPGPFDLSSAPLFPDRPLAFLREL